MRILRKSSQMAGLEEFKSVGIEVEAAAEELKKTHGGEKSGLENVTRSNNPQESLAISLALGGRKTSCV